MYDYYKKVIKSLLTSVVLLTILVVSMSVEIVTLSSMIPGYLRHGIVYTVPICLLCLLACTLTVIGTRRALRA